MNVVHISQYENRVKINDFSSVKQAAEVTGINYYSIIQSCKKKVFCTGKKYIFCYKNDTIADEEWEKHEYIKNNVIVKDKCVIQQDLDENVITIHESIKIASERTAICYTSIINCCKGRLKKAGNYIFKYKDIELTEEEKQMNKNRYDKIMQDYREKHKYELSEKARKRYLQLKSKNWFDDLIENI